ncbi:MAG: hypothetical protein RR393_08000 [Bacteroidales bacterium]
MLNDFQKNALGGDIIEDRGNVVYVGTFRGSSDETGTENCLIRKIEETERKGITIVRILYPEGINYDYRFTWSKRETYNYKYANSK